MALGIILIRNFYHILHNMCQFVSFLGLSGLAHSCLFFPGGAQEERYIVTDITKADSSGMTIIEEVEVSRAMFELYEGGIVGLSIVWLYRLIHEVSVVHAPRVDFCRESPDLFPEVRMLSGYRSKKLAMIPRLQNLCRQMSITQHLQGILMNSKKPHSRLI